jgi:hypothetical protein
MGRLRPFVHASVVEVVIREVAMMTLSLGFLFGCEIVHAIAQDSRRSPESLAHVCQSSASVNCALGKATWKTCLDFRAFEALFHVWQKDCGCYRIHLHTTVQSKFSLQYSW